MPVFEPDYIAPKRIRGSHLQTVLPARFFKRPAVSYRRERIEMPDGDALLFDWAQPEPEANSSPLLVLFHGLEGDSHSHYAEALMAHCSANGIRGLVAHFRGCGGEMNRLPRAYFAGDTEDNAWVLHSIHSRFPEAPMFAVGVSLGGNQLAKCLGDLGDAMGFLSAAAVVGTPVDLVASNAVLSRGVNVFYERMFLATLKEKVIEKAKLFPDLFDVKAIAACRTLYDFDTLYTAPNHGFKNAIDYWTRCSSKSVLKDVRVPLLLLNAGNDPFVPTTSLPRLGEVSDSVYLECPREGGHIGFPIFEHGRGSLTYLPRRIFRFFFEDLVAL